MVALLHLHGVAQRAGGAGDDGDLLHRGGIGLLGGHKGVADLVIGYRPFFLVGENGVLLLIAGDDHLNAFLEVGLRGKLPSVPNGPQRRLIDNVGKLCAAGAGGHAGYLVEVHIVRYLDFPGVDFQNGLPALQIRQLHRHPAVKPAGTGQGGVKGLGTVGGGQNDDAGVALKAIHLR